MLPFLSRKYVLYKNILYTHTQRDTFPYSKKCIDCSETKLNFFLEEKYFLFKLNKKTFFHSDMFSYIFKTVTDD